MGSVGLRISYRTTSKQYLSSSKHNTTSIIKNLIIPTNNYNDSLRIDSHIARCNTTTYVGTKEYDDIRQFVNIKYLKLVINKRINSVFLCQIKKHMQYYIKERYDF